MITRGRPEAFLGHRIDRAAGEPLGGWVEWRWEAGTLHASNDALGGYPLFYAARPDRILVSPSIDAILDAGVDRALDLDALAAFLAIGYYLWADTPFTAIRALPPGTTLTWDGGRLDVRVTQPPRPQPSLSRRQAADGLAELVRQAVRRHLPGDDPYLLPISGGRDSRHLLLELLDAGCPPRQAVTAHHHPNVWGGDVPYAANLCRELGVAHAVVTPGRLVADEWRKNRLTSYCADEHAWYLAVADALNGKTRLTYDGLHGGTFTRYYYTPRIRRLDAAGRHDELAAYLGRKQHGEPRFAPLVSASLRSRLSGERAAARIHTELRRYASEPEPFLALRFWNRTSRELNLPATLMLHAVPLVHMPLKDPEIAAFGWTIPTEHIDETFHDEVIRRRFPEAGRIPYRPRTMPTPSRAFLRELNRDLLSLLRRRSDGTLVDRTALLRRAGIGAVTGDGWFAWGRRAALTTYLVQLETLLAGPDEMAAF
jgi:asparagine synthase (glutamine-hydrolysing)